MANSLDKAAALLADIDGRLAALTLPAASPVLREINRWRGDGAAARFHLLDDRRHPPLIAVLGGTGTGKSTLVNLLLDREISATSFRRTFTSGPIAAAAGLDRVPAGWLGIAHRAIGDDDLPARGESGVLIVAAVASEVTAAITLVDTPDIDGDQAAHRAEADRVFRWATEVIFLVTPEKYQMTELPAYYRLAKRYDVPCRFVMNKCEEQAVMDDYRTLLVERGFEEPELFALPRQDAAWEPPPGARLEDLRAALRAPPPEQRPTAARGVRHRCLDAAERLRDTVVEPLRRERHQVDALIAALRAMEASGGSVDVMPLAEQLRRRMQEQSILYLMGPGRMLDRVRQVPGLLARLPRTAWDLLAGRQAGTGATPPPSPGGNAVPDFRRTLEDHFVQVQARLEDVIRGTAGGQRLMEVSGDGYAAARIDPARAGDIAEEELAEFKAWLDQHWNAPPRDTRMLVRLLQRLPGGKALGQWSEAAPYLLALVVATHGAVFGPVDLIIIGGFSLATWVGEKLSNEVTARARRTNRQIGARFAALAGEQIHRLCGWLDAAAPSAATLDRLDRDAARLAEISTAAP